MSGRLGIVGLLAFVLVTAGATPALAHGRGSDASNFATQIVAAPDLDGLEWRVYNGDEYLGLTNTSDAEVVILDYEQGDPQPYLRIGPDGVFENQNSRATYLNRDRFGTAAPTDLADEPDWLKVSDEPSYAWHDHRMHWMSSSLPPAVALASGEEVVVYDYQPGTPQDCNERLGCIPFEYGGEQHELGVDLRWIPGGSPWVWVLPPLILLVLVLLPTLRSQADLDAGRWPGLARPAAVILGMIAVANLIHLIDDLTATPIPLSQSLIAAVQTAFFIAIGLFGAVRGWQGREGAFTAIGVGSAAIFVGQGLLYQPVLSASQDASVFPGWLTRVVIGLSLAQVLPLIAVALIGNRRLLGDLDAEEDDAAEVSSARA